MRWPTPQEYNEAVQNPRAAFRDAELAAGTPTLGALGLPKAVTGNFATVYRVGTARGDFAVRCFLREQPDQYDRYSAIGSHLRASHIPALVDFDYQAEGIRVGAHSYPMLKMQWIPATSLDRYIERNLNSPEKLSGLVPQFAALIRSLADARIAHGDLQHGNIIVEERSGAPALRLIDYDGMWVPALDGRQATELGHPNYQHPSRRADLFGPYLDAFSSWSILTSLLVLAADSRSWTTVRRGDEQLLFAKGDYLEPWNSRAMEVADALLGNTEVAEFGRRLFDLALDSDLAAFPSPPSPLRVPTAALVVDEPWWKAGGATTPTVPGGEPWWLTVSPVTFANDVRDERALALLALASAMIVLGAGIGGVISTAIAGAIAVAAAMAVVVTLAVAYILRPEVRTKREATVAENAAQVAVRDAERDHKRRTDEAARATRAERDAVRQADVALERTKADEAQALRAVEMRYAKQIAAARDELAGLGKAQTSEMGAALRSLQQTFMQTELARFRIYSAGVNGIGPTTARRLASEGFATAADVADWRVSYYGYYQRAEVVLVHSSGRAVHVDGVGEAKSEALVAWARGRHSFVQKRMPTALQAQTQQAIAAKYATRTSTLRQLDTTLKAEQAKELAAARTASRSRQEQCSNELRIARAVLERASAPFATEIKKAQRTAAERKRHHAQARRDLDRYVAIRPSTFARLVVRGPNDGGKGTLPN